MTRDWFKASMVRYASPWRVWLAKRFGQRVEYWDADGRCVCYWWRGTAYVTEVTPPPVIPRGGWRVTNMIFDDKLED